ncbi:hypothetical protein [Escherichia coli]|uniref:hypothetical protein n=1 Tax=Escherichia coli TaxID=562 RepID=UPI000CFD84B3|nr:hypothetical protein [Escherichia coli]
MNSNALLKNSSLFVAYMGCLGWGSAYFYGWGVSFYYGFPWWVVSAGIDDVARSLFHAITIMVILFLSWGAGVLFFLGIKNKASMHELSFFRLFLASFLLFVPVVIEFSVLKNHLALKLLTLSVAVSLILVFLIRTCGHRVSASCFSESIFVKKHISEICLVGFVIYFWIFSFSVGFYKPQFKKEYEMMNYNDGWYYVLARYDTTLVLSKSFKSGNGRFLVIRSEQLKDYEFNMVRVNL